MLTVSNFFSCKAFSITLLTDNNLHPVISGAWTHTQTSINTRQFNLCWIGNSSLKTWSQSNNTCYLDLLEALSASMCLCVCAVFVCVVPLYMRCLRPTLQHRAFQRVEKIFLKRRNILKIENGIQNTEKKTEKNINRETKNKDEACFVWMFV